MNPQRTLFRAAAIADSVGQLSSPGAVLMEGNRILAAGTPQALGEITACQVIDRPYSVIIPGLVNAHAHLDLTHIGPQVYSGQFVSWINELRASRATIADDVDRSVQLGVKYSRAGGTALIGDIAGIGSLQPIQTLRTSGMAGVSYLELFGLGTHQERTIERMTTAIQTVAKYEDGVALGLQPHAPYSCGLDVYRAAMVAGLPLATHLAETLDEITFVESASGPFAEMLKHFGVWDDAIKGHGCHPLEYFLNALMDETSGHCKTPVVAAHLNYIDDRQLQALASTTMTVAFCPRASWYFGHRNHRYREMLDCGINVALGTDSIICLDTPDRISVLDEMRLLHRRDGVDFMTLLRMATINGARGLGFDPSLVSLSKGAIIGLLAIDFDAKFVGEALQAVLRNDRSPEWVCGPFDQQ